MTPDLTMATGWLELAVITTAAAVVLLILGLAGNLAALARKHLPSPCARRNAGTGGSTSAPAAETPHAPGLPERARTGLHTRRP